MEISEILTQAQLKKIMDYNPLTGLLTWKDGVHRKAKPGVPAGCKGAGGYTVVTINRKVHLVQRIVWLFMYGEFPAEQIVFINGKKSDFRIANLRLRTKGFAKSAEAISPERLKEVLRYDPKTGVFTWNKALSQRASVGSVAGAKMGLGYILIAIDGRRYLAHRLAWLYVYNEWPDGLVDHINGVRDDNRIENLREATVRENGLNTPLRSTNTSGFKGVSYAKRRKKWTARITSNYQVHILGYFSTKEEAYLAYCEAAKRLHGEFART